MNIESRIKNKKKNLRSKAGFTLLYASMVAGILLAIGAAILNITLKQVTLAAAGRESQFAFYAADTGSECAMYLYRFSRTQVDDCPAGLFPAKGDATNDASCEAEVSPTNPPSNYNCLGQQLLSTATGLPLSVDDIKNAFNGTGVYSFSIQAPTPNDVCFDVTVDKSSANSTKIISRGYSNCQQNSTNRFERAIELDF